MKRVAVLGSSGAGKTVFTRELGAITGLPVFYLDPLVWKPGWELAPADEIHDVIHAAASGDEWIIDGDFLGCEPTGRFERVDTVVFLDLPRRTCLRRIVWRRVRDARRSRVDLPAGCKEGIDRELVRWVWRFPRDSRPRILELLRRLPPRVAVHQLRSARDVRAFLSKYG